MIYVGLWFLCGQRLHISFMFRIAQLFHLNLIYQKQYRIINKKTPHSHSGVILLFIVFFYFKTPRLPSTAITHVERVHLEVQPTPRSYCEKSSASVSCKHHLILCCSIIHHLAHRQQWHMD